MLIAVKKRNNHLMKQKENRTLQNYDECWYIDEWYKERKMGTDNNSGRV